MDDIYEEESYGKEKEKIIEYLYLLIMILFKLIFVFLFFLIGKIQNNQKGCNFHLEDPDIFGVSNIQIL
jgi:hypothetical protein